MKLFFTLIICSLFVGYFSPVLAGDGDIHLTVKGEVLSARLKATPLKDILEKLKREKGIWFRGDSSLLEEQITVQFTELSLEKGLNRILSFMNHSLLFDRNERLIGVIVIGKGITGGLVSENKAGVPRRTILASGPNEQANMDRSFAGLGNSSPAATGEYWRDSDVINGGGVAKVAEKESEKFTVVRDCPPPGIASGDNDDFTEVKSSPPPDGPANGTEEDPDDFTVTENCPPPGGSVEVTAEELHKFTPIKNCPPPKS